MSRKQDVPDAWDDDWVETVNTTTKPKAAPPQKITKAERRAQHLEQQKQLWDSADNPGRNLWLEAQGAVPNRQEFKPQVTLLSRKPPQIAKRGGLTAGIGGLNLEDEEDSEEEARRKLAADMEERQRKAKLDHEEKQRRYAEARERIMGSSQPSPASNSRESSQGRDHRKPRVRATNSRRSQPDTPADQSPARAAAPERGLFDPDDVGRRLSPAPFANASVREEQQPLRQPRGPDSSGRGGFGFANRGGGKVGV